MDLTFVCAVAVSLLAAFVFSVLLIVFGLHVIATEDAEENAQADKSTASEGGES